MSKIGIFNHFPFVISETISQSESPFLRRPRGFSIWFWGYLELAILSSSSSLLPLSAASAASKQASNKTTKKKKYERSSHLVKEKETNDPTLGLCVHQGAACASTLLRAAFPFLSISLWSAGLRGKALCVVLW
jgi:hypothetical protein